MKTTPCSNFFFQLNWFPQVFVNDNAVDNLIEILLDVYGSMDPKFDELIDNVAVQHTETERRQLLEFLIKSKETFNLHVTELDNLFLKGGKF